MAKYIRCQTVIPHSTGLPENAVVNSWSFIGNGATRDADAAVIATGLTAFYVALKASLSSDYAWSSGTHNFVDMEDARPRVPWASYSMGTFGANSTTNNDFPPEVSLCVSMAGAAISGVNARRRRGRVFIGPLQVGAGDSSFVTSGFVDVVAGAAQDLLDLTNVDLAVYSRYTHCAVPVGERISDAYPEVPALLDDAFIPVAKIWVDNAYDTQRRRGKPPTYRNTQYPTP